MFKKLRKWYFKIYHLFKLIGIFILIFGLKENVYAEEVNSCYQNYVYKSNISTYLIQYGISNGGLRGVRPSLRPADSTKPIYIKFWPKNDNFDVNMFANTILVWDSNATLICQDNKPNLDSCTYTNFNYDSKYHIISFKYKGNAGNNAYFGLKLYNSYTDSIASIEDTPIATTQDLNNFLACEPQETGNTVLSDFLTLYINKIDYLAKGFTNNPYLLAMIGIIFSFIVLELTLKIIHIRGGRKK